MVKNNFNEAVKETMKHLNINQSELAKLTGYSVAYISNLLNGNKRWNEETIFKVSGALGIEITYEVNVDAINH